MLASILPRDIAILVLPIAFLTKLNMNRRTRLGLLSVFLAGILSTISSCIRLYYIALYAHESEALYDAATICVWSLVEINLSIVCASGPSLRQLLLHIKTKVNSSRNISNASSSVLLTIGRATIRPKPVDYTQEIATIDDLEGGRGLDPREGDVETIYGKGNAAASTKVDSAMEMNVITVYNHVIQVRRSREFERALEHVNHGNDP